MDAEKGSVRLDKWVWAARCYKTRSQATKACSAGQVAVNGEKARASHLVRPGDRVEVLLEHGRRTLQVVALGERRGSAEVAAALFQDLTPPAPPRLPPPVERERGSGRPTKRDRRKLGRLAWDEAD